MKTCGLLIGLGLAGVIAVAGVDAQRGPLPGAAIWTEKCAGCHGTGAEPGRAPNLFDEAWLNRHDDARVSDTIKAGVTATEMPGFASSLSDLQVFLVIRMRRPPARHRSRQAIGASHRSAEAFYTGSRYPSCKNTSLFVAGLRGQALMRFEIKGKAVVSEEVIFNQLRESDEAGAPWHSGSAA